MNYKSKQQLTEVLTTIALSAIYALLAFRDNAPGVLDLAGWAQRILIFIAAIVLINVLVQIVFHVFFSASVAVEASRKREENLVERIIASSLQLDERDVQINHRAGYLTSFIQAIGFLLSVIFLASGAQAVIALHILLAGFVLTTLAHGVLKIIAYERSGLDG